MNINKLQIGTKVKILYSFYEDIETGAIGYVVVGTSFHEPNNILDRDGAIWVSFSDKSGRFCFKLKHVKILCYKPKEVPAWVLNASGVVA